MASLEGRVALVAGATRGAGRGIATALGEKGAVVYCTGRTSRKGRVDPKRPETIEETAELVTKAGGQGIAVRTDHGDAAQVRRLVAKIDKEQGRLDVLVNDIWGGDPLTQWGKPFWELDLDKGFHMLQQAVHTHIITAREAVPLMVPRKRGLIVEITDGDGFHYRGNLFYDLVKTTVIRLAWDFAEELRPHGVSAVAVTPGFLRSEAMLDHFGVTTDTWRDAIKKEPHFAHSETPLFVGRAVAALAGDPVIAKRSGRVFASWTLAKEYGFNDADGSRPDIGAHFAKVFGPDLFPRADDAFYRYWGDWRRLSAGLTLPPDPGAAPKKGHAKK